MSPSRKFAGLVSIACLIVAFMRYSDGKVPAPGPKPGPVVPVDPVPSAYDWIKPHFANHHDDAQLLAGLTFGLAEFLEQDGKTADPVVGSMFDFADFLDHALFMPPTGTTGRYDAVTDRIAIDLGKLGNGPEKLDDDNRRRKIVSALRDISRVLESV